MEVVASLSQGRTAAAQCGSFTHKSVPVIFEPPCTSFVKHISEDGDKCGRNMRGAIFGHMQTVGFRKATLYYYVQKVQNCKLHHEELLSYFRAQFVC